MRTLCCLSLLAVTLGVAQEPTADQQPATEQQPAANQPSVAPAAALASIRGVVRNAATGEPLPRALVRIEGDADTGALTDGQGRFEIPGVAVGPQIIRVRKPGFHDRPYATEEPDNQSDGPAHSVLVAAEMAELNFTLTPTSAIHGHIELSTGDPAQGITLTLLKQVIRNGRSLWTQSGDTQTNGEGAYRFAGLREGVYALFTRPALESEPAVTVVAAGAKVVRQGYSSIFFPDAREFADAARIRLPAGQQAEANLLLTLEPFYTVTATAIMPSGKPYGGNRSEGFFSRGSLGPVIVLDASGRRLAYTGQFDSTTNTFQANLPDGTYSLAVNVVSSEANTSGSGRTAGKTSQEAASFSGFAEFSVEGHAVLNLRIPLLPLPSWTIHLRTLRTALQPVQTTSNTGQRTETKVTVSAMEGGDVSTDGALVDASGEDAGPDLLELEGVSSGHYWLSTEVNDRSLCVDSFTAGGINLAREPLNVGLGASPPPMELMLRDDCAKLALSLPPMLAAFLPGDEPFYTVYVVPDFDTTADIPPMNIHPSSGATVTVDGLTPGSYHIYTFDHPVRLEYRNPAVLAALPTPGQAVTLSAGTTGNLMLEVPQ